MKSGLSRPTIERVESLRNGQSWLAQTSHQTRKQLLLAVAQALRSPQLQEKILLANRQDLANLKADTTAAFKDRLTLSEARLQQMATSLEAIASLKDPLGEIVEARILENGISVEKRRAPLGVILMIFEARPNVITEVFGLALMSGNAIALRGGSDSQMSANAIYDLITNTLLELKLQMGYFVGLTDVTHQGVTELLHRNDLFDLCIPRGGDSLIAAVTREAKMPVIKNDRGLCHVYVEKSAQTQMALDIIINGKTQRPSVCNSIETVLIDQDLNESFLLNLITELQNKNVEIFACENLFQKIELLVRKKLISETWVKQAVFKATDSNFATEYLDLKINLKAVSGLNEALQHIQKFGSKHSECIVTEKEAVANRFLSAVDCACAYWNASTRFTDGFELGLGGEIGISTQKLHARGPIGIKELTSIRWILKGQGQIRS